MFSAISNTCKASSSISGCCLLVCLLVCLFLFSFCVVVCFLLGVWVVVFWSVCVGCWGFFVCFLLFLGVCFFGVFFFFFFGGGGGGGVWAIIFRLCILYVNSSLW